MPVIRSLAALLLVLAAFAASAATPCPRGHYWAFMDNGTGYVHAVIDLPSPGWGVSLDLREPRVPLDEDKRAHRFDPEPAHFDFLCTAPLSPVPHDATRYRKAMVIPGAAAGARVRISDAQGMQTMTVAATMPRVELPDPDEPQRESVSTAGESTTTTTVAETSTPGRGASCGRELPACGAGLYCDLPDGSCGLDDAVGSCEERPYACTKQYAPVEACDGKIYGNACMARAAGHSVRVNLQRRDAR